jgi:hypothetical protein
MGILTATVTNPTNPVLTVSWKDLLNYQLFAVNSLTGRRVPLRRIARANNTFSIKLSQFKRTHRLLKGTYYLSAVSLSKSVSSQSFAIEDLTVSVSVSLVQGNILTVTIANPSEINPEPEPDVYATLFLVHSTETTKMFSALMYAKEQPSEIFPEVSTYTLSNLKLIDNITPLVSGAYVAQIYFGNKPQYTASDSFYYSSTGEWGLSDVLQVGNTASADIDMNGNDLNNVNNLTLNGLSGTSGQVLSVSKDGLSLQWTTQPSLSPATEKLDLSDNNIVNTNQIIFSGTTTTTDDQGIYSETLLLNIYNKGIYNNGTEEVGDIHLDTGANGNVRLGGISSSTMLMSPLVVDSTNLGNTINSPDNNNVGIDLGGKDLVGVSDIMLSSNITATTTEDNIFVITNSTGDTLVDSENAILHIGRNATNAQLGSKLVMSTDPADSINKNSNTVGIDMGNKAIQNISDLVFNSRTDDQILTANTIGNTLITNTSGGVRIDCNSKNVVLGHDALNVELRSPIICNTSDTTARINANGNKVGIDMGNKSIDNVSSIENLTTINANSSNLAITNTNLTSNISLAPTTGSITTVTPLLYTLPDGIHTFPVCCGAYMYMKRVNTNYSETLPIPISLDLQTFYSNYVSTDLAFCVLPGYKVITRDTNGNQSEILDNTYGTQTIFLSTSTVNDRYIDLYYNNVQLVY